MLLHCTKKLAAKVPADVFGKLAPRSVSVQGEPSSLGAWHGHLLILDRRLCLLFCHDLTRYVLFLPCLRMSQVGELGRLHRELFLATLAAEGVPAAYLDRLERIWGPLRGDTKTDCSVLASLRVAADDLQYGSLPRVANVLDLDPMTTSRRLNERPCRVRTLLIWPAQAMLALIDEEMRASTTT